MRKRESGPCLNCGRVRRYYGRGLCRPCHRKVDLNAWPRSSATEVQPPARPECLACESGRPRKARGLCNRCYVMLEAEGWLEEFPRLYRRREDVLEDWAELRDDGVSMEAAARRMGMTLAALEGHLVRAVRRGDPRGRRRPFGRVA